MKLSCKMILIFSVILFITITINTIYLSYTSLDASYRNLIAYFERLEETMVQSIERYIVMMDLALDDLTTDSEFIRGLSIASDAENNGMSTLLTAQNAMSQTLYHSAVVDNFYRVSVYAPNGFFLSSHFEKNDILVSFSDEAHEIINQLPWLDTVKSAPFQRHIIPPHIDPFCIAQDICVFSAIRVVMLYGQPIGYVEVSSGAEELASIFGSSKDPYQVQAVFTDGTIFYKDTEDCAVYNPEDFPLMELCTYRDPDGCERYVMRAESRWLGLNIYVSEDVSISRSYSMRQIYTYFELALLIFMLGMLIVILVSFKLTQATWLLTDKVNQMPVSRLISEPYATRELMVTRPADGEIHTLEKAFDHLMAALRTSVQNELFLRENSLKAQLKALQAQINPHFVYNTLNIISAKSMESGNEEISEICNQFAQMLRYSTDTRSEVATLEEELEHVKCYLQLSKARYEENLVYTIDVPQDSLCLKLPKLTLQPLVENALSHGYNGPANRRDVSVLGEIRDGKLCLTVRDNGVGFSPEKLAELTAAIHSIEAHEPFDPTLARHIGLLNTYRRLFFYSSGAIHMWLENDGGALVHIDIPVDFKAHDA